MVNVRRQSTIRQVACIEGVSLHHGRQTKLCLRPAPINTGLIFRRTDITDRDNLIAVTPSSVAGVRNCTTLSNAAGVQISTIEHLLSALCAAGIDNLIIDLDGDELPAVDGSAGPFLQMIERAGLHRQAAPRRYVRVLDTVEVKSKDGWAKIEPAGRLELDVTIVFDEEAIGHQRLQITPDVNDFRERLASARTFARIHEVEALQEAGLSLGGSLENAVVVDGANVLNPEGLRFDDEFVRHKALDLMGDMYLGGPLLGRVTTFKSGHGLNHDLLTALFATPEAWEYAELPGARQVIRVAEALRARGMTRSQAIPA